MHLQWESRKSIKSSTFDLQFSRTRNLDTEPRVANDLPDKSPLVGGSGLVGPLEAAFHRVYFYKIMCPSKFQRSFYHLLSDDTGGRSSEVDLSSFAARHDHLLYFLEIEPAMGCFMDDIPILQAHDGACHHGLRTPIRHGGLT